MNNRKYRESLTVRLMLFFGLCLMISIGAVMVGNYLSGRKTQIEIDRTLTDMAAAAARKELIDSSLTVSSQIKGQLEESLVMLRTLSTILAKAKDARRPLDIDRSHVLGLLESALIRGLKLHGVFSVWEPGGLDGLDESSRKTTGSDANGRFAAHIRRTKEMIRRTKTLPAVDTGATFANGVGAADFYQVPQKSMQETIIDPTPDPDDQGRSYLVALSAPIYVSGDFYGVVGAEIELKYLQEIIEAANRNVLAGRGKMILVSHGGWIAGASGRPDSIGGRLKELRPVDWEESLKQIQEGKPVFREQGEQLILTAPFSIGETERWWGLMIEVPVGAFMDRVQAKTSAFNERQKHDHERQIYLGLAICIVALIVLRLMAGGIVRPIRHLVRNMKDIVQGEGDLTRRVRIRQHNEIGELAHWFNTFLDRMQEVVKEIQENIHVLHQSSGSLASISTQMASGAEEISSQAGDLAENSTDVQGDIEGIAAATGQLSVNVSQVAAAIQQMTSSLEEVAKNTDKSASVTRHARTLVQTGGLAISELMQSAREIGKVVDVIQAVADQTKLLALNATIEAARAGAAGKGFVVVAGEVKDLARQTSGSTEDIRRKIAGIQADTEQAVEAMNGIMDVIGQLTDFSGTIAASVEQQSAATAAIALNVTQAATGAGEVSRNASNSAVLSRGMIQGVGLLSEEARQAAEGIEQIKNSAQSLAGMAARLQDMVDHFKV